MQNHSSDALGVFLFAYRDPVREHGSVMIDQEHISPVHKFSPLSVKDIVYHQIDTTSNPESSKMLLPSGLKLSSPVREWLQQKRDQLKPWLIFVSTSKFNVPQTPDKWTKRVIKNLEYFQSNYMFVSIILIIYCLLTSPFLLLGIAAFLGACYIITLRNAENKLIIGGHEITLGHQYIVISILSIPVFYIAGATAALFWILGASFFSIMLHASLYDAESIDSEDQPFIPQIQEV